MITWFTGQPGAGKTTLAKALIKRLNHDKLIHLDGDDLRELMDNKNYSKEGRIQNIRLAQNISLFLEKKGLNPVVSLVAPYRYLREELKSKTKVFEIYVHTSEIRGREEYHVTDYNPPKNNFVDIDTTNKTIEESINEILNVYR